VAGRAAELGLPVPRLVPTTQDDPGEGQAREAAASGARLLLVAGGDGTVRAAAQGLAGSGVPLGILPQGTGNLLARNLGIPQDDDEALDVALTGADRSIDLGRLDDGQVFAVMAGTGFDALMIAGADDLKDRIGRAAYLVSGSRHLREKPFKAAIDVDGTEWFSGRATCILVGNVGELFGGVEVFPDALPDDGKLELGVCTADGLVQWARTLARTARGNPAASPFVRATKARAVKVRLDRKVLYELDGGDRKKVKSFKVKIEPGALSLCVPGPGQGED
jgi:YegS/Rv2252/BmrU family lipid kinase